MAPDKQRALAVQGGRAVPSGKRSFSTDRELASAAGQKGGRGLAPERHMFAKDRALAVAAGSKGGKATSAKRIRAPETD